MSKKGYIAFLAVILVIAGLILYVNHQSKLPPPAQAGQPQAPDPKFDEATMQRNWAKLIKACPSAPAGNPHAKWTVLEVGDFQCPNCGDAEPLITRTMAESNGKAKMYFLNFPITNAHPHALVAAEAGEAAAAQNKFWPMYQLLYSHQDELIDSEIEYNAQSIAGLDTKRLAAEMASHKYIPDIVAQVLAASAVGLHSVPTVFVRSPTGKVTWYCGTGGTKNVPGIAAFASNFPWGGGLGAAAVEAELKSEYDAERDAAMGQTQ